MCVCVCDVGQMKYKFFCYYEWQCDMWEDICKLLLTIWLHKHMEQSSSWESDIMLTYSKNFLRVSTF